MISVSSSCSAGGGFRDGDRATSRRITLGSDTASPHARAHQDQRKRDHGDAFGGERNHDLAAIAIFHEPEQRRVLADQQSGEGPRGDPDAAHRRGRVDKLTPAARTCPDRDQKHQSKRGRGDEVQEEQRPDRRDDREVRNRVLLEVGAAPDEQPDRADGACKPQNGDAS